MPDRFLVTGALGCLGAWTCALLLREGVDVTAYDLGTDPRRPRLLVPEAELARLDLVQGDIADLPALERLLDDREITHVLHLAALQIPFCREDPPLGALVNVVGTANVFEAVKRRPDRLVGPVVYCSSAAAYDPADAYPAGTPAPEDVRAQPATLYGVYKVANEGTARVFRQDHGVASVGVRPYAVYGPGRDQGVTAAPTHAMRAAARGEAYHVPYGGRSHHQHAADVARALIAAARSGWDGAAVCNLGGDVLSIDEVLDVIGEVVPGSRDRLTSDPAPLPLPAELGTGRFEEIVGPFRWTPFVDGVRDTVDFFRAHPEV